MRIATIVKSDSQMFQFLTIVRSDGGDDAERDQDSIKIMITPTGSLLTNNENYMRKKVIKRRFYPLAFFLKTI